MSTAAVVPNPFVSKAVAEGDYEVCPAGNKLGVLIAIVDLGTFDEVFTNADKSEVTKEVRKIALFWELGGQKQKNGRPFIIGDRYNYGPNMGPKSGFRKMLEGWRGAKYAESEDIDPMAMLDVPAFVNILHNKSKDKTYANIGGITPAIEGMSPLIRSREPLIYHVSMGEPPDTSWLPYVYGEKVADMLGQCKERGGKGVKKVAADKSASGPDPKRSSDLDYIDQVASRVIELPVEHPSRSQAIDEIRRVMDDAKIERSEISNNVDRVLPPF